MTERNIFSELVEGLEAAIDRANGLARPDVRTTTVLVPDPVDVRAIRVGLGLSQSEFARRFALPLDTVRKWERGQRRPDSASRAYLTVIARNPDAVRASLAVDGAD